MSIYEISFDPDTFQSLRFLTPDAVLLHPNWTEWFIGDPMIAVWKPVAVDFEPSPTKLSGDFPSLGGIPPVFSERAKNILEPLISDSVEFLPLACKDVPLYAVNVTRVLDCLDLSMSQFKRFSDGRIMRVERYVFKRECLEGEHMFKIPQQVRNRIYVSEIFKQTVENARLQGMFFYAIAENN